MKKLLFVLACAMTMPLFAARTAKETTDSEGWLLPGLEGWQYKYETAKTAAAESKIPLLVVFVGSDWSSSSKHLMNSILKAKTFRTAIDGKVVPVLIEYYVNTKAPEAQTEHNAAVRRLLTPSPVYPCTVIVKPDGKTISGKIEGDPTASEYLSKLTELLK